MSVSLSVLWAWTDSLPPSRDPRPCLRVIRTKRSQYNPQPTEAGRVQSMLTVAADRPTTDFIITCWLNQTVNPEGMAKNLRCCWGTKNRWIKIILSCRCLIPNLKYRFESDWIEWIHSPARNVQSAVIHCFVIPVYCCNGINICTNK